MELLNIIKINIFPITNDTRSLIFFIFLVLLVNMTSLNIFFYQAMYLYIYLFLIFLIFLIFGFNQYVGFLLIIEFTAITFIIAIIAEFNFLLIFENKILSIYVVIPIVLISIFFNYSYYYKFNYYFYYFNYYKNCIYVINNDISGLYNLLYKDFNLYLLFLSTTFVIFTFILVYFFFNYVVPTTSTKTVNFLYYITQFLKIKKLKKNEYPWESVLNTKTTKFK